MREFGRAAVLGERLGDSGVPGLAGARVGEREGGRAGELELPQLRAAGGRGE